MVGFEVRSNAAECNSFLHYIKMHPTRLESCGVASSLPVAL